MSEHVEKGHVIGAFIALIAIVALVTWGIGLMNDGDIASAAMAGVLLLGFGCYVVLSLAKPDHA